MVAPAGIVVRHDQRIVNQDPEGNRYAGQRVNMDRQVEKDIQPDAAEQIDRNRDDDDAGVAQRTAVQQDKQQEQHQA